MAKPSKFAHVVYRTRRFEEMIAWYQRVFDAKIQMQNPGLAFLTYDDEHHRFAFANLDLFDPEGEGSDAPPRNAVGVDHVAYSYPDVATLLETYERLRDTDVRPYWCVHHGVTLSMYFRDPDGNQMEFQVDCFEKLEEAHAFMHSDRFEANPIGVTYDPDALLARYRGGAGESELLEMPAA